MLLGLLQLVNGTTVTFDDALTYEVGDRWTCVWRRKDNFMWRAYETTAQARANGVDTKENRFRGPNDTSRRAYNARRSHLMIDGGGALAQGINGRSMIQLGVDDGLSDVLSGDPIAFPFERNTRITTDNFYDNLEEMMFEEGFWSSGSKPRWDASDRKGDGFGIHQMGFWRGIPVEPSNSRTFAENLVTWRSYHNSIVLGAILTFLAGSLSTDGFWRLSSGPKSQLLPDLDVDGNTTSPLFSFVQSGTYNASKNNKKDDIRMNGQLSFVQGFGADGGDQSLIKFGFETIPDEELADIYYEIDETFTCLNGVHFGTKMSQHQRQKQVITFDEAGSETQDVTPIEIDLDYYNCYAWSNGIEAVAIRDEFGANSLARGAKASSVLEDYEERDNVANLIYSGTFNDNTGLNGLNEFSSSAAALQTIVKQMDTQDGSIQKLFSRDTDLIVFQEDKVSKVLTDKSALYNADGSSNLTSLQPVLGQTISFLGEFGISKDPESFAYYGGRIYFTDRQRGAVLRLSQDGLTEISNAGMRDFFRNELAEEYLDDKGRPETSLAIGSYDDYHDQYILTLRGALPDYRSGEEPKILSLSRQAFLSRTEACRYPEEDLQFAQVYEFYSLTEPAGFQKGDIIYYDVNRTSEFKGDNDWFVWFDSEVDLNLISDTAIVVDPDNGTQVQTFSYTDTPINPLTPGQKVSLRYNSVSTPVTATVVTYNQVAEGQTTTMSVRYDPDQSIPVGAELAGAEFEIDVNFKFVININNFGTVVDKQDCVGIVGPNHDAFRMSIFGYDTPEEACGKGIVGQLVYHNGDDPTPDKGDSIYDGPYASDEYIDGNYMKGRTQKRNYYKMFDGANFDDYVIRILQGKVVDDPRLCDEIMAGRRRILTSENPSSRRILEDANGNVIFTESDSALATRVCSVLPTDERWLNSFEFPVIGDTVYEDNFTEIVAQPGYYAIEGGYYIRVNDVGMISLISRCSIEICIEDVAGQNLIDFQNQKSPSFTFLGIRTDDRALPTITATTPTLGVSGSAVFNGSILTSGDFDELPYSWFLAPGDTDTPLTERQIIDQGAQIGAGTTTRAGEVGNYTQEQLTIVPNLLEYICCPSRGHQSNHQSRTNNIGKNFGSCSFNSHYNWNK